MKLVSFADALMRRIAWGLFCLVPATASAENPHEGEVFEPQQSSGWFLEPAQKAAPPDSRFAEWARTNIDRFIAARWEEAGIAPAPDAGPRELVRRLSFDLVGLPPSPAQVKSFIAAPTQENLARLVDEFLASKRYGERWGRHWLDVARYAESSGMEFNFTYPHNWPYRDYVIQAFNDDTPYDRFVKEQLAGDLLPAASQQERERNRLATGFLAIGPKRHNAGKTEFLMDLADDQIRATTEAFLGLTVGCARCHDHKFDPITAKDYYALAGIFLSTETLYGTSEIKYSRHPTDLIPFGPDAQRLHEAYAAHQQKVDEVQKKLTKAEADLNTIKLNGNEKGSPAYDEANAVVQQLRAELKEQQEASPEPPLYATGVREGKPRQAHIALGGDPRKKGDQVSRGMPAVIDLGDGFEISSKSSGRLELAQWIVNRRNPLTARVMVNRVWSHLFGRGLVGTVDNFGSLGAVPTHPVLLDYLASQFVEQGWSVKQLIRSIVLSRTYQLSTGAISTNLALDPDNSYYWRMTPRRLDVEPLRDAMLAASGQLDLSPPHGSTVTALGQQLARAVAYEKLNPPSRHRSVYLPIVRHYLPHIMQEFDYPSASFVVGKRSHTTTAQQALYLLNSPFVVEQSRAMAQILERQIPDDLTEQVRRAYLRAVSRPPTDGELQHALQHIKAATKEYQKGDSDPSECRTLALASFVHSLFGSVEFRYLVHPPRQPSETPGGLASSR